MPCYLFTYHAYGTWMPDRKRGYVKRRQGILPADPAMAANYRAAMKAPAVRLRSDVQLVVIDSLLESQSKQSFELYYVATDETHAHALLGWRDTRAALHMRAIVKGSVSRRLKHDFDKREWLAEAGNRKQVKDREHFDYLVEHYLPNHRGWKWCPQRGKFR